MAAQIRFGYRCATCGTTGDTILPDDSREVKTVACADCGGSVTLARNDGSPDAFQSDCRSGPEIGVRGRDGRSYDEGLLPFLCHRSQPVHASGHRPRPSVGRMGILAGRL